MAIGTFGSFTQARLAIYAAQTGITVTGNNISNINTPGYTRQRLDQVSLYAAGSDRYYAEGDIRVGQGALVKSISQIRNPYLDIRYREESAKVGFYDARLEGLNSIQRVLDEVGLGDASKGEDGYGILGLDIMKLASALRDITDKTSHQEYDDNVKAVAKNIADRLHTYANQLEQVRKDTVKDFKQDIEEVNNILDTIRNLNEEIRKCEIHGDPALELRDSRNNELDKLSSLIDIDVTYTEEEIAAGLKVEKLQLRLGNANPDKGVKSDESLLIDGVYSSHLILGKPVENPAYKADAPLYLDENGNETNNPIGADGVTQNPPNPAAQKYLKVTENPDGTTTETPVSDIRDATIITDDEGNTNYNMMITELKNKNGDLNVEKMAYAAQKVTDTTELDELIAAIEAGDIEFNNRTNKASTTVEDQPAKGDKTITIYTRTLKDHGDPAKPEDYIYSKQVYEQIISKPVALDDNDLGGELQAERELLTEEGVFSDLDTIANIDENAAIKRGIGYYQKVLDLLANQFASAMNEANQGFLVDPEGNYIKEGTVDGEPAGVPIEIDGNKLNKNWEKNDPALQAKILNEVGLGDEAAMKAAGLTGKQVTEAYLKGQEWNAGTRKFEPVNKEDQLDADGNITLSGWAGKDDAGNPKEPLATKLGAIYVGAPLFSNANNSDDITGITASNINISMTWSHTSSLVRSLECPVGDLEPASGQSENLLHLAYITEYQEFDFIPSQLDSSPNASDKVLFNGCFYDMWNDIGGTLGQDQSEAGTMLDTYYQSALSIDTDRDSVSSVDFNDEAMNLMMYAKSYNAACRLMTTIDSVLDKLINNTGMTT